MPLPLFFFSEDKPTPRSATPSTSAHPHEREPGSSPAFVDAHDSSPHGPPSPFPGAPSPPLGQGHPFRPVSAPHLLSGAPSCPQSWSGPLRFSFMVTKKL